MTDQKTTHDLGILKGKLLFFGGVYSNLQALEALRLWASENSFASHQIFCTGDIGGYCANPMECFDLIRNWQINTIAGNVELQLKDNKDDCGCEFSPDGRCDLFSKTWYNYIKKQMDAVTGTWLTTLPHHITFTYAGKRFAIVHGSWFNTSEYIFDSTSWLIKKNNLEAAGVDTIVAGHCGLPFLNRHEHLTWFNPGVIGMPANDGLSNVWFATLELRNGLLDFRFHPLHYDHTKAAALIVKNQLPVSYAKTLETGIWDNCEILPAEEAGRQGFKLTL